MTAIRRYDCVLLDALGTLLDLEPPWPHLVEGLARRGADVGLEDARRAMVAEMTYYKGHCDAAGDRASLDALRDRCADIVAEELGEAVAGIAPADVRAAMLESLRFPPFPEVREVLADLRAGGARLVIVSNWDVSLHDVLAETGLDGLVDVVLTSAETGLAKPAPGLLERGLELAGAVAPSRALMVGDTEPDAEAALAAGVDAVLVARHGPVPVGARRTEALRRATYVDDLRALRALVYPSSHG